MTAVRHPQIAIGFYQVLMSASNTLQMEWPQFALDFFAWMKLFTFNIMVLPFIGCLQRRACGALR